MLEGIKKVHLVGIGGAGMSGIARILLKSGYSVSGSDIVGSEVTKSLAGLGAKIYTEHRRKNTGDAELVIYSSAISLENPELETAMRNNIPCFPRGWFLSEMMKEKVGIAVTGTHGKTTTSSMIALILKEAGLNPTVLLGGDLDVMGGNACLGTGNYFVAEADESDGSFLMLSPEFAVVTNIEGDHLDYYGDTGCLMKAFEEFVENVVSGGGTVFFSDDPGNLKLIGRRKKPLRGINLYGLRKDCDVRAGDIREKFGESSFSVYSRRKKLGEIKLKIPGMYNIYNALGAVSAAMAVGAGFDAAKDALYGYRAVKRRFEIRGEINDILVVEDYAHHPTEIKAALGAAKLSGRRLIAVFQPHRYTRTEKLADSFGKAFDGTEILIVTDIYGAGESPIRNVSSEQIAGFARKRGHPSAHYIPDMRDVPDFVKKKLRCGDMLLVFGAGSINEIIPAVLENLKKK